MITHTGDYVGTCSFTCGLYGPPLLTSGFCSGAWHPSLGNLLNLPIKDPCPFLVKDNLKGQWPLSLESQKDGKMT